MSSQNLIRADLQIHFWRPKTKVIFKDSNIEQIVIFKIVLFFIAAVMGVLQ